jgi:hypothetical protein
LFRDFRQTRGFKDYLEALRIAEAPKDLGGDEGCWWVRRSLLVLSRQQLIEKLPVNPGGLRLSALALWNELPYSTGVGLRLIPHSFVLSCFRDSIFNREIRLPREIRHGRLFHWGVFGAAKPVPKKINVSAAVCVGLRLKFFCLFPYALCSMPTVAVCG